MEMAACSRHFHFKAAKNCGKTACFSTFLRSCCANCTSLVRHCKKISKRGCAAVRPAYNARPVDAQRADGSESGRSVAAKTGQQASRRCLYRCQRRDEKVETVC